ncbi:MAG TPA: hypothetical protein PLV12_02540, partial [Saprospiraceae bacterium]|nr:hypothetical protein [Saprospiraceae bacterium]
MLSILSSGITLFSQAQNLILDHYTDREGLTTLQALTITHDNEGYIWVGTENGLVRYDGHRFKY